MKISPKDMKNETRGFSFTQRNGFNDIKIAQNTSTYALNQLVDNHYSSVIWG